MANKNFGENGKSKSAGKSDGVAGKYDAPFRGYINLNLSKEEKEGYGDWATGTTLWDVLDAQVADGVNVAVKIDPKGEGFLASATQRRFGSPNAGLVVTARARDAATAFGRLVYCLAILSRSEAWEDTQPMADPDRW